MIATLIAAGFDGPPTSDRGLYICTYGCIWEEDGWGAGYRACGAPRLSISSTWAFLRFGATPSFTSHLAPNPRSGFIVLPLGPEGLKS